MKNSIRKLTISLLAICLCQTAAHCAIITWSAPANITGDSDVSTNGAVVYAYDWAENDEVVNGVTFTGEFASSIGTNLSIAGDDAGNNNTSAFTSGIDPFAGLSTGYQGILVGAALAGSGNQLFTMTLNGLVAGDAYQVQVWVSDPKGVPEDTRTETVSSGANTVVLDYSAEQTAGSPGQFTIGSFTADNTSQSFTLLGADSTQVNALQLRNLGLPPATITYVGTQYDLGPGWRTSSVRKPLDIDGDNVLGSDGYTMVTLDVVQPDYVDDEVVLTSTYPGNGNYAQIDNPTDLPGTFTSGTMNPSPGVGLNGDLFFFTFNANAVGRTIRVGLMVDNLDTAAYNAFDLELIQTNRNEAVSGPVATTNIYYNDRIPDWIFFDIQNPAAGDGFIIQGTGGDNGTATLGGVAFDSVLVGPPQVTTLPATDVYATTATMNATVNPNGDATQVYFQYGATTNFGSTTATSNFIVSGATLNFSNVLTGLAPGAICYYRIVASNGAGTNVGEPVSFTTGSILSVTDTADDDSPGTLRAIVQSAVSGDTIQFDPSLDGETILVTNGVIALTNDISIDASDLSGGLQINGNTNSTIFEVTNGAAVVLDSVTITNGVADGDHGGGGIIVYASILTLNQCAVSGNSADDLPGGGISSISSRLTLNQCTLSGNSVSGGDGGGAIEVFFGDVTLNECTLSGNSATNAPGGGIYNFGGALTLNQCTLAGNSAYAFDGGGIFENGAGVGLLAINQCTISGNFAVGSSGGGLYIEGQTGITNSIVAGNAADVGGSDIYLDSADLNYGGANIVESVTDPNGAITGATPMDEDPELQALGNYGGPTQTMMPEYYSPAIDAGSDLDGTNFFSTDQRGYPRLSGQSVDIGAVEVQQAIVGTSPASNTTGTDATENGTITPGDYAVQWYFEYGTTTGYGKISATNELAAGMDPISVSNVLGNLALATTYHFQLFADDGVSAKAGGDASFTTLNTAPSAVTESASGVATNAATLNGAVNANGLDSGFYFKYGPTTNFGSFTATNTFAAGNTYTNVSAAITGLTPNATYYYEVVATNSLGVTTGSPASFTALALVPVVATEPATGVGPGTATFNATINPGYPDTSWYFRYGPGSNYVSSTPTSVLSGGTNPVAVSNVATGLLAGTNYSYEIVAQNSAGSATGLPATFSTPVVAPLATTLAATGIGATVATLNATVNPGGTSASWYFQYGATTNYGAFSATNALPTGNLPVSVAALLTNLIPSAVYHYQILAVNSVGSGSGADSAFTNPPAPIVIIDSQIVVAITSPPDKFSTNNSRLPLKGTVKGGGSNPQVQVTVNNNAPVPATLGPMSHGSVSWTCAVPLAPGANTITAETTNSSGPAILSSPAVITVFYLTNLSSSEGSSTVTLNVSPEASGHIIGKTTGDSLKINKVYTIKAAPIGDWIFTNWTGSIGTNVATVLGSDATLSFTMAAGLTLQANFITNPFTPLVGTYNGLFSPAEGASEQTSGFFSATLAPGATGAYSAKLLLDGGSYSYGGSFDLTGDSEVTVARRGEPPVEVLLHLNVDLPTPDDQMTGYVINFASNGWTSALQAYLAPFSRSTPTTDYAGKYTVIIPPGSGAPASSPGGYSYATLNGSSAGMVSIGGSMADKSSLSQSVGISKEGNIPLYIPLYSKKGSLQGWLTLTNETTNQQSPVQTVVGTNLAWFKPGTSHSLYQDGFTNTGLAATGSIFSGDFVLTNGTLTLSGGDLSIPMTFDGITTTGNALSGTNTEVKGKIIPGTGVLNVTITPKTGHKITATGVVLQDTEATNAAGWFLGTNESGYFLIEE